MTSRSYYFGYGTYLNVRQAAEGLPGARIITIAHAANNVLEFRQDIDGGQRGWCNLSASREAWGRLAYGVVIEIDGEAGGRQAPHLEARSLTVYGADSSMYDCWTYCLSNPGDEVRVPPDEWEDIVRGFEQWELPVGYRDQVEEAYLLAQPCLAPPLTADLDLARRPAAVPHSEIRAEGGD